MEQESVDVSVVIGFMNWGLNRLELAVKSIQASFGDLVGEVIVSDYGSDDYEDTRVLMESLGARYVYTSTDGTWSRSRALNAGFAVSSGAVLVSTDADMVFSPKSMETIASLILNDSSLCLLLQCRDLPEDWSDAEIAEAGYQWSTFEQVSRLRPRWGMGGMMAVPRGAFIRIRGLDERMHTYGGEDIDFATRAKRAGQRLLWVDDERVRMYHMWHAPTRKELDKSKTASEAIEFNKEIVYDDKTFVRNTPAWKHPPIDANPLVTVAISTYNRAEYLAECLNSVLAQTMQDFEIVVVDDGSTDDTRRVVASFGDPRIRYFYQENAGIAAARNRAADEANGTYTAVHDDDDLMTPWRLEKHFEHITVGTHGSFGSFINFGNESGEMKLFASKMLNSGTILETGGAPGHGTWMVETEILRRLRYDESLSSGVDNNLALRMVRSGVVMNHSGEIMMLRRMHDGQVTVSDEQVQKTSARQTRQLFSFVTSKWGADKIAGERGSQDFVPVRFGTELNRLVPYLPDHLVCRTIYFSGTLDGLSDIQRRELLERTVPKVTEYDADDSPIRYGGKIAAATLADIALLARTEAAVQIEAELRSQLAESNSLGESSVEDLTRQLHRESFELYSHASAAAQLPVAVLVSSTENVSTDLNGKLHARRFIGEKSDEVYFYGSFANLADALEAQIANGWRTMELNNIDIDSLLAINIDSTARMGL